MRKVPKLALANKISTQWWPNIIIKESKQTIHDIYFVIMFLLLCLHYIRCWFDQKLELRLRIVSVLLKVKFGDNQISVPTKIGIPMLKTACINLCLPASFKFLGFFFKNRAILRVSINYKRPLWKNYLMCCCQSLPLSRMKIQLLRLTINIVWKDCINAPNNIFTSRASQSLLCYQWSSQVFREVAWQCPVGN